MERTPFEPPKPCFGLELSRDNPACPRCPHKQECAQLMGHLADRVNVDEAHIKLLPIPLERRVEHEQERDPDLINIDKVYSICHEWVFRRKPSDKLPKDKGILLSLIRESEATVRLYFLTNMLAWEDTHHTLPFRSRALTGPHAVRVVKTWGAACHERFGVFNTKAIDMLIDTNLADNDFVSRLLNSEIIAGSWIIGYKLTSSGDVARQLYSAKEIELDPYWLAIEETYISLILHPWVNGTLSRDVDPILRTHRHNAVRIHGLLKKEARRAILLFMSREQIMPQAIRSVLGQRHYVPSDFKILRDTPITSPLKFWAWLGVAIQQIELRSYLLNEESVYV